MPVTFENLVARVMEVAEAGDYTSPRAVSRRIGLARHHVDAATEVLLHQGWLVASRGRVVAAASPRARLGFGDVRALSAECRANPLVAKWISEMSAGAPGLGRRS